MKTSTHFFGSVRVYSNANANKKFKAAADALIEMVEQKHYNQEDKSKDLILSAFRAKIDSLDAQFPRIATPVTVSASPSASAEYRILLMANKAGCPVELAEVLCYKNKGEVIL